MPFLLFVGAATGLLVTSLGAMVWDSTRSTQAREQEAGSLAHRRAVALAEHRGQLVSVWLTGGKSSTGILVTCDDELLVILIDTRKPRRASSGHIEFPKDPPAPSDLTEIDLSDVTRAEIYLGDSEDA